MRLDPSFLDEIRNRLPISHVAGRIVKLTKAGREFRGISPFNAERSPSFYVNDSKRSFFDFSANKNGTIFDFVMLTQGLSFPDAVEQCAREAGLSMPTGWRGRGAAIEQDAGALARREADRIEFEKRQADKLAAEAKSEAGVRRIAAGVWAEGVPIAGTAAEAYLLGRGIDFGWRFGSLRFHNRLEHRHPETGERTHWPALIAAVRAPDDGRFLAIWRIYLDAAGNKAPLPNVKLGLGTYAPYGGSVWLGKPGPVSNAGEGIESSLGVVGILGGREPVQATLSTSGMVNFVPPRGAERVLIWPDGDTDRIKVDKVTGAERHHEGPGIRAGNSLRERLREEGMLASVQPMPQRNQDFLDVYNRSKALFSGE